MKRKMMKNALKAVTAVIITMALAGIQVLAETVDSAVSSVECLPEVVESMAEVIDAADSSIEYLPEVVESMAEVIDHSNSSVECLPDEAESVAEPAEYEDAVTIRLGFVGDVNLDEEWDTTKHLDEKGLGMSGVLSENLIELLKGFDVFMLNNEFTYSTRGEEIDKTYHFRADPSRIQYIEELGTDVVLLANNHVFDYGTEAFSDTLQTLTDAGIAYVGAGLDIEEAASPYYFEVNGRTIAYVAATQSEMYNSSGRIETPGAGEDQPGVFECYDPELLLKTISEARSCSDYVVVSIHWGMEYEPEYRENQKELARAMFDAGAEAVIGSHTHCLQGIDLIDGKPVFYSLGNFWFNDRELDSGAAELTLRVPGNPDEPVELLNTRFYPLIQSGLETVMPEDELVLRELLDRMEELSMGAVELSDAGDVAAAVQK